MNRTWTFTDIALLREMGVKVDREMVLAAETDLEAEEVARRFLQECGLIQKGQDQDSDASE